ncbi:MAG: HAMP domain-containing histidine kinase [Rhodothermales bacterium]|nr:HAMP domain-containing histidine kinase [Rhodothermales bacterium]
MDKLWGRLHPISHWSISARLTVWYGLTMLIFLSVFAILCYLMFHQSLHRDFDRHLTHEQRELLPYVVLEGDQPRLASLENLRSVAFETDGIYGTYVRLFSSDGSLLYSSPNFERHEVFPAALAATSEDLTISHEWEGNPARSLYRPLMGDEDELVGWLEVTGLEWSLHEELQRLLEALVLGVLLSLVLAIGGGFLLARRALRPVVELTGAAHQIGATNLSDRLPTDFSTKDELTELAETFNELIARIEASVARERRFTANAAHELLTPLTTMRNSVEVSLRRVREPETYQTALETILADAEEMSETVRGLLTLSRVDRLKDLQRDDVNLSKLSSDAVSRYQDRARRLNIEIIDRIENDVFVTADRIHLAEILDNLIDNALKYTPGPGTIEVHLQLVDGTAILRVTDDGVGFEPEQADQLSDRFYRADVPEVQAETGSGLGLSIVKAITEAYDGTFTAHSDGRNQGARFQVILPQTVGRRRSVTA